MSNEKSMFRSKIGLIAATVGSAVGLGTIWRFPAETAQGGGAAFLIVYIACVFLLGVPVMLAEFSLGRASRSDAVGTFRRLSPGMGWWGVGAAAVGVAFLINCFYMVVCGWTLEYFAGSVTGDLFAGTASGDALFEAKMEQYVMGDGAPLIATLVAVVLNALILLCGVRKGIERMANVMMPLLFVLLAVLCCYTLSLDGASAGVKYFLSPDFSKITPGVCINALGQALFSLSLGMGILITYASYFPADTRLGRTAMAVSSSTIIVALLVGLTIFPAIAAFNFQDAGTSGTALVFLTMPRIFDAMPLSQLWAILFFSLLLMAAVTSTVSIAEVAVAFARERWGLSRRAAVLAVTIPLLFCSGVCALSFGCLKNVTFAGLNIFESLDTLTNTYILPLVALGGTIYAGWFAPRGLLKQQLTNDSTYRNRAAALVIFIIRWLAPVAILTIFITNIIQ